MSRVEAWSGVTEEKIVPFDLPEAVARAVASQPGNVWIDDLVAALAELRPEGYEDVLKLLAENLPTAVVTFQLSDGFHDAPVALVRWLDDRGGVKEHRIPKVPPARALSPSIAKTRQAVTELH